MSFQTDSSSAIEVSSRVNKQDNFRTKHSYGSYADGDGRIPSVWDTLFEAVLEEFVLFSVGSTSFVISVPSPYLTAALDLHVVRICG